MQIDVVAQIKSRLTIEDVVSSYVNLKKVGNSLKGLCPFHNEKTPSFIVSPDRGIAYCFGCHKGGDIFKFVQEVEGIDFSEALKFLAEKAGVEIKKVSKEKIIQTNDEKRNLLDLLNTAKEFYKKKLFESENKVALDYLLERKLNKDAIEQFELGLSPDSFDETHKYLMSKGFDKKLILKSGLAIAKDTSFNNVYDRFRGRVMFPQYDSLARVVGFGGRILKKSDTEPKYLNSPESPVYQKSNLLYGFAKAKTAIKSKRQVVVVEGYMDLIACHLAGISNAVGVSGTALTKNHLTLLKPYIDEVVLAFDMDKAGKEAVRRAFEIIADFDFSLKVVQFDQFKDLGEVFEKDSHLVEKIVSEANDYGDYMYKNLFKNVEIFSPIQKENAIREFAEYFEKVNSSIVKDDFIRRLSRDLGIKENLIYDQLKHLSLGKTKSTRPVNSSQAQQSNNLKQVYTPEEVLLGYFLEFPELWGKFSTRLNENLFSSRSKEVYKLMFDKYNLNAPNFESVRDAVLSEVKEENREFVTLLSFYVNEKSNGHQEEVLNEEVDQLIKFVLNKHLKDRKQELLKKIQNAESKKDFAEVAKLLEEFKTIS